MKLVVATDVRFWRRQTGAQQRIAELVLHLIRSDIEVTIVFLASIEDAMQPNEDRASIESLGLNVVSVLDDWQPKVWIEALGWRWRGLRNAVKTMFGMNAKTIANDTDGKSKRIADFISTEWQARFRSFINRLQPDVVIVEYITLAYLVPERDQRRGVRYWIDTHDCLSERCQQFQQHGLAHWVEVSSEEEALAIDRFDGVIAIQAIEAATFESWLQHQQPVVVAGHPTKFQPALSLWDYSGSTTNDPLANFRESKTLQPNVNPDRPFVLIGMLASDNGANRQGVQWFFEKVWQRIISAESGVGLVLAGSICDWLASQPRPPLVKLLGSPAMPAEFYEHVSIVVNPIQFGTGLKIKNIEALGFGKPLVTTAQGAMGLITDSGPNDSRQIPLLIAADSDTMVTQLLELVRDSAQREALSNQAQHFVETQLSPEAVFRSLINELRKTKN